MRKSARLLPVSQIGYSGRFANPARTLSALARSAGQLVVVQVELHDLFDAVLAEAHRNVHVEILDAVLPVDVRAHAHHLVRIREDGLHHLRDWTRRARSRRCRS